MKTQADAQKMTFGQIGSFFERFGTEFFCPLQIDNILIESFKNTEIEMKQHVRVEWIDILKGFAMLMVLESHLPSCRSLFHWVTSFEMPLFFMLAGMTAAISLSSVRGGGRMQFVYNKCFALLVPYAVWSFVVYPYDYQGIATYSLTNHFYSLYSGLIPDNTGACTPVWFLMSLFILQMCGLLYVTLEVKYNLAWKGRCILLLGIFASMAGIHRLFGIHSEGANVEGIGYLTRAYVFFIPYAIGLCYWRYSEVRNVLNSRYARFLYVLVVFLMPFIEYFYHPSVLSVLRSSLHGCCISLLLVMVLSDMDSFDNKVWIPFKQIGKATMVIYVFHWILLPSFRGMYAATFAEYSPYLQFWINFGAAILISYSCIIIGKCVGVSPLMGFLLMGQRVKKRIQTPAVKGD